MIGFTLRPHEDELLYSIIARHGTLIRRTDATDLTAIFFGRATNEISTEFSSELDVAAVALGATNGDALLHHHTAHLYATSFATVAQRKACRDWAFLRQGKRPVVTGVMSASLLPARTMAFCRTCSTMDADGTGLLPWRRAHQLPGVFVCHLHGTPLSLSAVSRGRRQGALAYTALSEPMARTSEPQLLPHSDLALLRSYAVASARLLRLEDGPTDLTRVQERLREMLSDFRWSRAPSLIATSLLAETLAHHPRVAPLLALMGSNWTLLQIRLALNRLLNREDIAKHPLFVLMILEFAGASLSDLLMAPAAAQSVMMPPTPVGPTWVPLCANGACSAFSPMGISEAVVASDAPLRFACPSCDFAIRMRSNKPGDHVIVRTCASWDRMAADAVNDSRISLREVSRRMAVSTATVMKAAWRCGVWRDDWKKRVKLQVDQMARVARLKVKHRVVWSRHVAGPTRAIRTKDLPKAELNAYRYLLKNDRMWLRENGGSVQKAKSRDRQPCKPTLVF